MLEDQVVAAGIDVGGTSKGYHAVSLAGACVCRFSSAEPGDIVAWCRDQGAATIAVDAPCKWSATGKARPAERNLMRHDIQCFSTPTREAAEVHPKNHFGWMLAGQELFKSLLPHWRLYDGKPSDASTVFETFPHAVACALSGAVVSAKGKATLRRALLSAAGIDITILTNIDYVDAGLCALTARLYRQGATTQFGDPESGFIVVPKAKFLNLGLYIADDLQQSGYEVRFQTV